MSPAARLALRVAANLEPNKPHPELVNGSLFTPKDGLHTGSIKYADGSCYQFGESIIDGGVQVNERSLAAGLRQIGLYNETHL